MRRCGLLLLVIVVAGCGDRAAEARLGGDPGGTPVVITLHYDRAALPALASGAGFTRTVVVEREPWPDPFFWPQHHLHACPAHRWYGPSAVYEPATSLELLIGDGPAEAQALRARITDGDSTWTIPLSPGHALVVSLQASGGREGWRELGRFTAAPGLQVTVHCAGAEPRVVATPAPGAAPTDGALPTATPR